MSRLTCTAIFFLNVILFMPPSVAFLTPLEKAQNAARLYAKLTGPGYNKTVIPASTCKPDERICPFRLQARLFLIRIQDLIENQETLVSTVRFQFGWIDPTLVWDPADYGGVDSITMPGSALWVPDLQIANSVEDMYGLLSSRNFGFRLTNDGQIWWHPTGKITTRCALDLTYYPFDYQRCSMVIESVIYTSPELQIDMRVDKKDPVSLSMFTSNERWKLVDSNGFSVYYASSASTKFSRVHFWLTLKRDSTFYQNSFLLPTALLSVIQLFTYLIPMTNGGRVGQSTVVLLSAFFLEGSIADRLPKSSQQSLVQMYLNILIGISVATIGLCILLIEILMPDAGFEWWGLPWVFKQLRQSRSARISSGSEEEVSCKARAASDVCIEQEEKKDKKVPSKSTLLAAAINLVGLIVCLVIIVVYPSVVFAHYVSNTPPPLPRPPPNNISQSYYAELL